MELLKVQSSNLQLAGWEDGRLRVVFHHGGAYEYESVPVHLFRSLLEAPSVGKFFCAEIKPKFKYTRLREQDE